MNYTIRWKDLSEEPQLIPFLEEKLKKIFNFIFVEDSLKVEYVYYKKECEYKFRLNAKIHKGEIIRSEAINSDIRAATVDGIDKMVDQLRKIKTKLNSNK